MNIYIHKYTCLHICYTHTYTHTHTHTHKHINVCVFVCVCVCVCVCVHIYTPYFSEHIRDCLQRLHARDAAAWRLYHHCHAQQLHTSAYVSIRQHTSRMKTYMTNITQGNTKLLGQKTLIFFCAFLVLVGKLGKQSLSFRAAITFFFGITVFLYQNRNP